MGQTSSSIYTHTRVELVARTKKNEQGMSSNHLHTEGQRTEYRGQGPVEGGKKKEKKRAE